MKIYINTQMDKTGETPLHLAARYARADAAKKLLDAKADANAPDNTGRTPLHSSVVVMESMVLGESRRKFWTCPELVDYLLIFLDVKSVFNLCQALNPALRVVQGRNAWNKLLRRASIAPTVDLDNDSSEDYYVHQD